jgi:uncharacterized membrane protein
MLGRIRNEAGIFANGWLGVTAAAAFVAILAGAPAAATERYPMPALFAVVDVAEGDVLNIRAEPDAAAGITGSFARHETGIEIVGLDETGRWGRVNAGEGTGWVAMRYLAAEPSAGNALPAALRCYGTEPFWGLERQGGTVAFSTPESMEDAHLDIASVLTSMTLPAPHWIVLAAREERRMTAVITPQMCSDGMSDRVFGLAVTLVDEMPQTPRVFSGCCSLQALR